MVSKGYTVADIDRMTMRQLHRHGDALVQRLEAEAAAWKNARRQHRARR